MKSIHLDHDQTCIAAGLQTLRENLRDASQPWQHITDVYSPTNWGTAGEVLGSWLADGTKVCECVATAPEFTSQPTPAPLSREQMRLVMRLVAKTRARHDAHDEAVAEWYRNGDGRRYGFSYPACVHGVSTWTDYDCACGACEAGYGFFDYLRELRDASDAVRWAYEESERRGASLMAARKALSESGSFGARTTAIHSLLVWEFEPIKQLQDRAMLA